MKQNVSPAVVAVAIIVVIAVVGFFAYRTFVPHKSGPTLAKEDYAKRQAQLSGGQAQGVAGHAGGTGAYMNQMRNNSMSGGMGSGGMMSGGYRGGMSGGR